MVIFVVTSKFQMKQKYVRDSISSIAPPSNTFSLFFYGNISDTFSQIYLPTFTKMMKN